MKSHDLSELSRELAALTPANRRDRLIHYLQSGSENPGEEVTPAWFDELMAAACGRNLYRDPAQHFAAAAQPTHRPLRLPSARLRRLRFRGEEREAQALAENLTDSHAHDRERANFLGLRPGLRRVDSAWIPGAKRAWERAKSALDYEGAVAFLIDRDHPGLSVRVMTWIGVPTWDDGERPCFAIFSPASLALPDPELTFLVGAGLAEMLFDHDHYRCLLSDRPESGTLTILPAPVEAAWLRWRMKAPVSTDRAGLLACGSLGAALRALLRSVLGLPSSALPTDDGDFLERNGPTRFEHFPSTLSLRIQAIHLFAGEFMAPPDGGETRVLSLVKAAGGKESDKLAERSVDEAVERLFPLRRPIAESPHAGDLASAFAAAGLLVLAADGNLEAVETRILIESLFLHLTDEPEKLLRDAALNPAEQLDHSLEILKTVAGRKEAEWLVARLFEVALADGRLLGLEAPVISRISEVLGLTADEVSRMIERAAGACGQLALPFNVAAAALRG